MTEEPSVPLTATELLLQALVKEVKWLTIAVRGNP